jgi:fructokinase
VNPVLDNVVDTVGAGDTFQAALLTRLSELGDPAEVVKSLDQAGLKALAEFAVKAASITCSRRGADLPRRNEI